MSETLGLPFVDRQPPIPVAAIDQLLQQYGERRLGQPLPVDDSILNENFRVQTPAGARFVRIHKKSRSLERLEREHAIIRWAGAHGIPVNEPLADSAGQTLHAIDGRFLSIFPWLEGETLHRGSIDPRAATTLGETLGRIHRAFAGYDGPPLSRVGTGENWDTDAAIGVLSRVDDLIRYYPAHSPATLEIQAGLRDQLELLESDEPRPTGDFADLPSQPIHGDYHERNVVLTHEGSVLAVIDWERVTLMPPVFEVLRCVTFAHLLAPLLLEPFLRAYREAFALRPEDCEPGVELWWQVLLHDTWVYRARFIEGDRRVDRFFAESRANIACFREPQFRQALADSLSAFPS